ncbi:metallophosphoesterase [Paenibacillus sp. XY044]|uniref:metallophosphoesterase n=1 Tax=Paenibacillus sp. XY044 TaxID=2026089 RepID=UPI000B98F38F|nr:metallophosphoesterase [Paenibacillus sp. XY044]OZB91013.1 phosphoesterase [Paenibacillus sp. XY044]
MKNTPHPGTGNRQDAAPTELPGSRLTRRQFLKRGVALAAGAGLLTGAYAWLWEPLLLDTVYRTLVCPRLPAAFHNLKVVHFSDVHLGFHTRKKHIENLVAAIRREAPELICFTGDIIDSSAEAMNEYIPLLASTEAPLGKFAVLGNHDFWGGSGKQVIEKLQVAGFRVLQNGNQLLNRGGQTIAVVGLDDWLHGFPDPKKGRAGIPDDMFTLLMMHEPDYAGNAALFPFDLQLSGHSHGGQVRLPLLGALMTPPGSKRYIMGMYEVGDRRMPLYVNRGIGETHLPVRFLCKPELTVFTLQSAAR